MKPVPADPGQIQQVAGQADLLVGVNITFQVMAVTDVSPGHQHAVGALAQGVDNEYRIDPARAHDPDGSQVAGILQPGYADTPARSAPA